jgi:hypothetical protein
MLFANADNQLKGAKQLSAGSIGAQVAQMLADNAAAGHEQVTKLITRAGMELTPGHDGRKITHAQLRDPR